jgi:hypothetical protein
MASPSTAFCMARTSSVKLVSDLPFQIRHSSHVVPAKTVEIDTLRFQDKDLDVVGTLEFGQYGVVSLFGELRHAKINLIGEHRSM